MGAALAVLSVAYCAIRIATAEDDAHTCHTMLKRTLIATVVILTIAVVIPWLAGHFGADGTISRIAEGISLWD